MSSSSFSEILSGLFTHYRHGGGGRRPQERNQEALDNDDEDDTWYLKPCQPHEARLTIVQITDVYTLDNFASLKTMLQEIRRAQGPACSSSSNNNKVISMLTGDFLAPYLLSSIDHGEGMMMAINETPIDYLTWGNHEADIPHKHVCKHVHNYQGTFINTNMQSHASMKEECSVPYEIIEVQSADGKHTYKIGLVALLSNDPKLYSHFKEPGAFGGATIEDPWETLAHYKQLLEGEEHGCDLVIPLEHMYVPENMKTTEIYKDCGSIPLILSGHDHHRIDQKIHNTRLIKPGMDGVHAAVIEIVFDTRNPPGSRPKIRSSFVQTAAFEPCPLLKQKTDAAYDVLLPLRNTMLAQVLPQFFPLTSANARGSVTTMGKLVCSMLKQALLQDYYYAAEDDDDSSDDDDNNNSSDSDTHNNIPLMQKKIDAVILMGGNIRGNEVYPDDAFFSLETLEAEIKSDEVVGFTEMPGSVLAAGIEATHAGDPRPGWMQYDDGITQDPVTNKVLTVGGKPINPKRIYRVATKIKDLTNGQSPPLKEYFLAHPELLPAKGQYVNIHSALMKFFACGMFRKLWEATGELIPDPEVVAEEASHPVNMDRIEGKLRLSVLDRDNEGFVTVDDIHYGLRDFLGLSVEDQYKSLAQKVHACADVTGTGVVSVEDFEIFCRDGMPSELTMQKKWEEAFPDPLPELTPDSLADHAFFHDDSDSGSSDGGFTPLWKRGKTESTATFASSTRSDSLHEISVMQIDF